MMGVETEAAFLRLLDASAAALAPECVGTLHLPDDEIHREILLPLLPSMIMDQTIRGFWRDRPATGFVARLKSALETGAQPKWTAMDFEIHVTSSYLAGADARALADTLLSEAALRDLTAAVMNTVLAQMWPRFIKPVSKETAQVAESAPGISMLVPRRFLSKNRRFLNKTRRYFHTSR